MQGTGATQVAAITFFFTQLGQLRTREGKRLTQGLRVSFVPLEKDSSPSMLVCPTSTSKSRHVIQALTIRKGKVAQKWAPSL